MSKLVLIKKRVERLEERVAPKWKEDIVVVFCFGRDDEPHGKYGYRKLHIHTGKCEVVPEERELELLRETYDDIPERVRKNASYWSTFDKFLEYHECKCGRHNGNYVWPKDYQFRNTNRP